MNSSDSPTEPSLSERKRLLSRARILRRQSSDLAEWTLGCRIIDGRPFDFRGHEYLYGPYSDLSSSVTLRKGAQLGASELAISRSLYSAIVLGTTTVFFLPTAHHVREFSGARFASAVRASRYLSSLVHDVDNAAVKQVGQGAVYFRGMRSKTDLKSVPGDGLVFDEIDEMIPAHVELARKRLGHSALGWELYVSTPTLPGYGIDKIFQASDQPVPSSPRPSRSLRAASASSGVLVGVSFVRANARRLNSGDSRRIDLTFRARVDL